MRDSVSDELVHAGGNHFYWEKESVNSQVHVSGNYSHLFKWNSKLHNQAIPF